MSDIKTHLFPFSVDREGPINTNSYLQVEEEGDFLETVVLGRKLVGTPVSLKETTTQGTIYEKITLDDDYMGEEEEEVEASAKWVKTNKTIDEFILWKKDTAPSQQDPRINALHSWIDISQIINAPIPLPTEE